MPDDHSNYGRISRHSWIFLDKRNEHARFAPNAVPRASLYRSTREDVLRPGAVLDSLTCSGESVVQQWK